ncbi:MAG: mechanosensitive ion channel, partial [Firmicutes bacterium]|nr:mechanosensitive ion channel [Bacillota bacterium]
MEELTKTIIDMATTYGGKIILALVVLIVGRIVIGWLNKVAAKAIDKADLDPTVNSLIKKFINILLYVILILSIIQILGVPMASVIAVLASCGLAVGLALQGALSNVAGGIMVLVTKPFKVGDFVEAAGGTGVVKDISLLYTTIV